MAKIIPFPQTHNQAARLVDNIIETRMGHKHPAVVKCLKQEIKVLLKKYYSHQETATSLILPADLTEKQFSLVEQSMQKLFLEQNQLSTSRASDLFLDLCLSRMTICELRHQLQQDH